MSLDSGLLGAACLALAAGVAVYAAIGNPTRGLSGLFNRYRRYLDGELRFLFSTRDATRIAAIHIALLAAMVIGALALPSFVLLLIVPPVAVAPAIVLTSRRGARVAALEVELDVWLRALANSLKAAPAIGDALRSSAALVPAPLSQEIELVLKEMALGVPLDAALDTAAKRIGSAAFTSVIATLLVARRTGGNLPAVLEKTAETVREMERLEGVLRTKTAESKMQSYVLGALPFGFIAFFIWNDPDYLDPFTASMVGYVLLALAGGLWAGSILLARKILAVDM